MPADLSDSFPQLTWRDQSIVTVDAGDSSAVITTMTIHLAQDTPEDLLPNAPVAPLLAYEPIPGEAVA